MNNAGSALPAVTLTLGYCKCSVIEDWEIASVHNIETVWAACVLSEKLNDDFQFDVQRKIDPS